MRAALGIGGTVVLVTGLPLAFISKYTLGLWILCGVVPVLWCLSHPADDDGQWSVGEGEE